MSCGLGSVEVKSSFLMLVVNFLMNSFPVDENLIPIKQIILLKYASSNKKLILEGFFSPEFHFHIFV